MAGGMFNFFVGGYCIHPNLQTNVGWGEMGFKPQQAELRLTIYAIVFQPSKQHHQHR